jgi:hypothetical protein
LTIDTGGRKEQATVARVGTPGANGTGVDLTAPLRLDHRSGVDVSDVGTGIRVSPPTRFAHTSGDAVQALGSGVTLDRPLTRNHNYGAPVLHTQATAAGYQGPSPRQWFGGVLSTRGGAVALTDAGGTLVVDAVVYGSQQSNSSANGSITSPEIATLEAEQTGGGCIAVIPATGGRGGATAAAAANRSIGRFPDGFDADRLCSDFMLQPGTALAAASAAGASNIKVVSVADFAAGQTLVLDTGANRESAVVTAVGTPGATTVANAVVTGATSIPVAGVAGFAVGQAVTIGAGANPESATIAAVAGGGRGGGATLTLTSPLRSAHAPGTPVSGSGITLATPLLLGHAAGAQVAGGLPTPGAANQYSRRAP